MVQLWF